MNQNTTDIRLLVIIAIAVMLLLFLSFFIALRNIRHKQKAYAQLQKQKEETELQKQRLQQALDELESMQAQLIQREKMASLGELTAGIAHEIQNPLNFVKNFSEVSSELVDELNEELKDGNIKDLGAIATSIKENLNTITYHSNRADSIIKGMMLHSRTNAGIKEPTDINKLVDEYLRLSYHGLRAKDKSFNATMQTNFDDSIGEIKIIAPDIGRVFLNLFNNAFYSVNEKYRQLHSTNLPNPKGYEPTVWVNTKKLNTSPAGGNGGTVITVRDNGTGIPLKLRDKILQPFFTTKPTGQGTGLGLSLSYDIIKAHGGELKLDTKEG
ncbi:MAG: sensor histidine kinase, partial [Chitinophagaceae bacterium]